jgi:hypothetical protein
MNPLSSWRNLVLWAISLAVMMTSLWVGLPGQAGGNPQPAFAMDNSPAGMANPKPALMSANPPVEAANQGGFMLSRRAQLFVK